MLHAMQRELTFVARDETIGIVRFALLFAALLISLGIAAMLLIVLDGSEYRRQTRVIRVWKSSSNYTPPARKTFKSKVRTPKSPRKKRRR